MSLSWPRYLLCRFVFRGRLWPICLLHNSSNWSLQMFDSHNYRTRPDVSLCCKLMLLLCPETTEMCVCYRVISVTEGNYTSSASCWWKGSEVMTRQRIYVALWNALKWLPKLLRNTPSPTWMSCSHGKYMFVGSNSVSHNVVIQLAAQIQAGHYSCSLMSAMHYKTQLDIDAL